MLIRNWLAVHVAGLQQQCEHVGAVGQRPVGARLGDERVDDRVETSPITRQLAAGTPATVFAPHDRRHSLHQGAQLDQGWDDDAKFVQRVCSLAESGAHNCVECEVGHRRQRFELLALWPVRGFAQYLVFDNALVVSYSLSVEIGQHQLAALRVFLTDQAECRAGPKCLAQDFRRTFDQIKAGAEDIFDQVTVVDNNGLAKNGKVNREWTAVMSAQTGSYAVLQRGHEQDALDNFRYTRPWRQPYRLSCRRCHVAPSSYRYLRSLRVGYPKCPRPDRQRASSGAANRCSS